MNVPPVRALRRDTRGANQVEYLLLVGLIALVCACAWKVFGTSVKTVADAEARRVETLNGWDSKATGAEGAAAKRRSAVPAAKGEVVLAKLQRASSTPAEAKFCKGNGCTKDFCFAAGTRVRTERGLVPIERVAVGDRVVARDEATGGVELRPVTRTFARIAERTVDVELVGADGAREIVAATPEHPFFTRGRGWVGAGDLESGDALLGADGRSVMVEALASSATGEASGVAVFNLEVEGFHTYFVGVAGAWVHNECKAAPQVSAKVADLGRQAKAGNSDARYALGDILLEGITYPEWGGKPKYEHTKDLDAKARRDVKLEVLGQLAQGKDKLDYRAYLAVAFALGEASANGDKELGAVARGLLDDARDRKVEVAQLAIEDAAAHPSFPGKDAIRDALAGWPPRAERVIAAAVPATPATPQQPAWQPLPQPQPAARATPVTPAPPAMTVDKAVALIARPGYFRVLDRDKNGKHWNYFNRGDLLRAANEPELPPEVAAAMRWLAQPENYAKLDTAWGRWSGDRKSAMPDDVVAKVDLAASLAETLDAGRAAALAHLYFDVLDAAGGKGGYNGAEGKDGRISFWDIQKAIGDDRLPIEARAAAMYIAKNFNRFDTAADDLAQTPWTVTEIKKEYYDSGTRYRASKVVEHKVTKSGKGGRPDSIIGKRDIETILAQELWSKVDVATAVEMVRKPDHWSKLGGDGGKLTRDQLEAAWKREDLPPDLRITARFLAEPDNFKKIAGTSGAGGPDAITRADLHAQRGVMQTLQGQAAALPAVEPSADDKKAFDGRAAAVEARVDKYAADVLPKIKRLHDQMLAEIKAARDKHPDGIPDDVTAKIREDYRGRIQDIVRMTGDKDLARDVAALLQDAVEQFGADVLRQPAVVRTLARMLDVDDARADFITLGAGISSKSEDRADRDRVLDKHKVAVFEELWLYYDEVNDTYYALRRAESKEQGGIISMPATGLVELWRMTVSGKPGMVELQREMFDNQKEARKLFDLALDFRYRARSPTERGDRYDEYWRLYKDTIMPKLGLHAERTIDYIDAIGSSRDLVTSGIAMIPSLIPGVGIVWAVAIGGVLKGGLYVGDQYTGGRDINWNTAGYNVLVGGLENLSAGVGGMAGKGVSNLTRSLGPLASTSMTVVVRGGTTGAMIGGGRSALAGDPLEKVLDHTYKGAAFGILFDAAFTTAGLGLKRVVYGPTPKTPVVDGPPVGRAAGANDTVIIEAAQPGTAAFDRVFAPRPGVKVSVTRSSGAVENDWAIVATDAKGRVVVGKTEAGRPITKPVDPAKLLEANPHLLEGVSLHVPRTNAPMDDGWVVDKILGGGKVRVSKGALSKELTVPEVIRFNADRLLPPAAPRDVRLPASGNGRTQSEGFVNGHRVEAGTPIADGYVDGGRGMKVGGDGSITTGREIVVVDRTRDAALQKHLEYARSLRGLPEAERAQKLAEYVDKLMTPAGGRGAAESAVNRWQGTYAGKEVLLGDVAKLGGGVCRHRSLLFKVLGDEAGLNVALVRGNLAYSTPAGPQQGGHAWNELTLSNGDKLVVDVMNPTIQRGAYTFPKTSATGDAYRGVDGKQLYPGAAVPKPKIDPTQTQIIEPKDLRGRRPSAEEVTAAKKWADELADTAPKPDPAALEAETQRYLARQALVKKNYDAVMRGEMEPPPGVSRERLEMAVEGDPVTGQRIPLTFKSAEEFQQFQRELRAIFASEGITDATVQQVGSATTGWRGNPNKEIAPWKPTSDSDFAIFSEEALAQAKAAGVPVNKKIVMGGKYTVLKNGGGEGVAGFSDTSLGKKLDAFSRRWNEKVYGRADVDGFDFKLNLSREPFQSAPAVLRFERAVPKTTPATPGSTRAQPVGGRGDNTYLGVPVEAPRMASDLPGAPPGRREFHVTVISPPEWAALPQAAQRELAAGVDIGGAPLGRGLVKKMHDGKPFWEMEVEWAEAQALRARYGLPPKALHVSLNGGANEPLPGGVRK